MQRQPILSFLDVLCVAPPWGTLAAVDLVRAENAWQVPLGTTEDIAPRAITCGRSISKPAANC